MKLTLIQAAKAIGKDRSTLFRAIKKGKLSGELLDDNSYIVDSSELFRVYPPKVDADAEQQNAPDAKQHHAQGELIDALRAQIEILREQVQREQEQADHWRKQATMLLTHQPAQPEPLVNQPGSKEDSPLWKKLFGRR